MQNKKSKTESERENKENFNNLSNCNNIKINANNNYLKDSHKLIESKCENEYKKKLLVPNKTEVEKKGAEVKQNLFRAKKNSEIQKSDNESNSNNFSNNARSMNMTKNSEMEIQIHKENFRNNSEISENFEDSSEINKERENIYDLDVSYNLKYPHIEADNKKNEIQKKPVEQNPSGEMIEIFNIENQPTDYLVRENSSLIKCYGSDSYNYIKHLENDAISKNFLYKHKINSEIRTKMVDWMIEVLAVYKSEAETFFLSVHLMDSFIDNCNHILKSEDIHLIGVTCMFIATKFEDIIPIRISCFEKKISHGIFNE
jgi:hypothetical protein